MAEIAPNKDQAMPLDEAGYDLIPLHRWNRRKKDKAGKVRELGKAPTQKDWTSRPCNNAETLARMQRGDGNTGVRLRSTDLVIDWDPRNNSGQWSVSDYDEFMLRNGLDPTEWPTVRTGSGGLHHYLSKPADMPVVDSLKDFPGIEFKSRGRQVVSPGSIHPKGNQYRWINCPDDFWLGAPLAPESLLEAAQRPTRQYQHVQSDTGMYDPAELATMLEALDPVDYQDHTDWLELMMACHNATAGQAREEFIAWSTSDPRYSDQTGEIADRWDSLNVARDGGFTYRTLHKALIDAGREDAIPRPDPAEDFDELDEFELIEAEAPKKQEGNNASANPEKRLIQEMNAQYCAVLDGGQFRVFMEDFDDAFRRKVWTPLTREAFRNYLQDEKVRLPDLPRNTSKADFWLDHPDRKKFRGIVMDPEGKAHNDGKLNLWQGWAIEPRPGNWSLMKELIGDILCDGDSASEDYVRRWIAYMLQKPWLTPEAAIAFRGTEGTGKGTLGRALMRIAGPHGLTVSSRSQFAGRFNSHLRNCVFLFADEAMWPGDKDGEGIVKQLVTEPVISYEAKGKDITAGRNMVHMMLASNEEWIVPAGKEARRFFVSDVSDRRRNDQVFFGKLWQQMDNGGLSAMMYDLIMLDLGDWRPSSNIPQTHALGDQKVQSLDPPSKFWLSVLTEASLTDIIYFEEEREDWHEGSVVLGQKDKELLVAAYDHFLKRNRIMSVRATHKALVTSGKAYGLETMRTGGKERSWCVPSLPEMRTRFEKCLGATGVFDAS